MKTVILILCLLSFNALPGKAQEVSFAFNSTYSGRNCALSYIQSFNKSEVGIGLRYNINQWAMDDQNNVYYKRQYAYKPIDHIGTQLFYHQFIWSMIYGFYDCQISYSKTLNKFFLAYIFDPEVENPTRYDPNNEIPTHDDLLYKKHIESFGPFTWVEQNVGIGFKFEITESLFLSQKIGVGVLLLFGSDEQLPQTWSKKPELVVSSLMNIGISYKF